MKLCTFAIDAPAGEIRRMGVVRSAGIVDASAARVAFLERSLPREAARRVGAAQVPPDMVAFIGSGPAAFEWAKEAVDAVSGRVETIAPFDQKLVYARDEVRLLAPVPKPVGIANFNVWMDHIKNSLKKGFTMMQLPEQERGPQWHWKGNINSVVGPETVVEYPSFADELDVECEIAVIIGTACKDVTVADAGAVIAGYTIHNDASVRSTQVKEMASGRGPSKGKDFDTGNVFGPWLVTPDEVGDVRSLNWELRVNGEQWSSGKTGEMMFSFAQMISYLSRGQTLYPGQIISAGCFAYGSGLELGRQVQPGDVVELKISTLGSLINTIGPRYPSPVQIGAL